MSSVETPGLDRLQAALAEGDMDAVRRTLLELDEHEQQLAREEMGAEAFERAQATAKGGKRRSKLGKVLVLPGIMGSELESVNPAGKAARIWLDFVNLIRGRIGELALTLEGDPAMPGYHVRTAGVIRKAYVPLLVELDTRWQVRPFAFDWREDLARSAARLDGEVKAFGNGDPVHLVAHSMGGLVSRLFAHRYPETWQAMDDPTGAGRGGRLLMLGTPNRGSFAIPLVLTGVEKLVRELAWADVHNDLKGVLRIIGTFPGLYQMLPSPKAELGDDHERLFETGSWANGMDASYLKLAAETMTELDRVLDPHRLLYVAGYNRKTPAAIRIAAPGKFSYQETLDGDGRVPHALGLLERDGVPTYYVDEIHGDLAKNGKILEAVSDLLRSGDTSVLPKTKPSVRGVASRAWMAGEAFEPVSPEAKVILGKAATTRAAGRTPALTEEEQIRLANLLVADYLGTGENGAPTGLGVEEPDVRATPPAAQGTRRVPRVDVEVVWGDITEIEADVYCVGHYQGVLPQRAELALDEAVSGLHSRDGNPDPRRLVITQQTRRGLLHGALGDVSFFPWGLGGQSRKVVAVAGMGQPGTFDLRALRRLVRELLYAVCALPKVRTVCTVLIGSGKGSLEVHEAVSGLIQGIGEAVGEAGESLALNVPRTLRIAEQDLHRACEIVDVLRQEVAAQKEALAGRLRLVAKPELVAKPGGSVSVEGGIALFVDAALEAAQKPGSSAQSQAFTTLLKGIPRSSNVQRLVKEQLEKEIRKIEQEPEPKDAGRRQSPKLPRFRVERPQRTANSAIPVRISYWEEDQLVRVAAIHQAATVPERVLRVDRTLIDDLVERMTEPPVDQVDRLCTLVSRLLVPHDFRTILETGPFVFEVDQSLARVHWEFLAGQMQAGGGFEKVALSTPLARQLRTTYSPAPTPPQRPRSELRALVVGDPGDPALGEDLPGARSEALAICRLLEQKNVHVTARIGAPSVPRVGPLEKIEPADRLDVLGLLLEGGFDILHYAGHGDFDPKRPDRAGWLFARGFLTPGELERVEHVPAIVVANACLTARTSQAFAGGPGEADSRRELALLPSLADEFFRLGVRNYIGTAWEVSDVGAILFAERFYDVLLSDRKDGKSASFGDAVLEARKALASRQARYGPLWAAYQHYGDPTSEARLVDDGD